MFSATISDVRRPRHPLPPDLLSDARYETSGESLAADQYQAKMQQALAELNVRIARQANVQWRANVLNPNLPVTAAALQQTIRPVIEILALMGDIDLSGLPAERVNGVHLAVVLRATATRKRVVRGWAEALDAARAALARQGIDEREVLGGLRV